MSDKEYDNLILGGGVAGLAAARFLLQNHKTILLLEKESQTGGNCRTNEHKGFRFDTGAHRLHDKIPEVTHWLKEMLGSDLRQVDIPSQIYHEGRYLQFPIQARGLLRVLGVRKTVLAVLSLMFNRGISNTPATNFKKHAIATYGNQIAGTFLLNYSRKLWGTNCSQLSPTISGNRLKGLMPLDLLKAFFSVNSKADRHMDGRFYYPRFGIGQIAECLTTSIGSENILCNAKVTAIQHEMNRIAAVEVNGEENFTADYFVNTIPLKRFIQILTPTPSASILKAAASLKYRDIILVACFLKGKSVTRAATVYFPDEKFPFTRIYEPILRSKDMAPKGYTSLVLEYPCNEGEYLEPDSLCHLEETARNHLTELGWITADQVVDFKTSRMPAAYPVLGLAMEKNAQLCRDYLDGFFNLRTSGRVGSFTYSWIHDHISSSMDIAKRWAHEQ